MEHKVKPRKAVSAGGVVVRHAPQKQILLTIYSQIEGLGFAKGHVEDGETVEQAAIREVGEETGLTELTIIRKLGMFTREATDRSGVLEEKDIHIFLMATAKPDLHLEADEQYGWFDVNEAVEKMAVEEDRIFLEKIIDLI